MVRIWMAVVLIVGAGAVRAELSSLFPGASAPIHAVTPASLFVPEGQTGMFAPPPPRPHPPGPPPGTGSPSLPTFLCARKSADC